MEDTFSALLLEVVRHRSWEALHALWAFPKAVLAPVGRGGKGHWAALGRTVSGRARAFRGRPVVESWNEGVSSVPAGPRTRKAGGQRNQGVEWSNRVDQLVGNGAVGKAASMLLSKGVHDANSMTVLNKLRQLHPHDVRIEKYDPKRGQN